MHLFNWRKKTRSTVVGLALLSILLGAASFDTASAQSGDRNSTWNGRYFLIVWAYQGPDDDLVHAHTFTSFYRGDDLAKGRVRPSTISWLPNTGIVKPFGVEGGHNFSLDATLRMACSAGREVKSWGPYEIKPELYRSAMTRIRLLQSGRVHYAMINTLPRSMNCITAAGDITPQPLDTGILWGVAASAEVVRHLSPYFLNGGAALKELSRLKSVNACPSQAGEMANSSGIGALR